MSSLSRHQLQVCFHSAYLPSSAVQLHSPERGRPLGHSWVTGGITSGVLHPLLPLGAGPRAGQRFNPEPLLIRKVSPPVGPGSDLMAALRPPSLILTPEQCSSQIFPVHNPQAPRRSRGAQDPSLWDLPLPT